MSLQKKLDKAGMLYSGHLSVACTFSWNHETNGLTYPLKILLKTKLERAVYGGHFFTISIESFVLEKPLHSGWYKKLFFSNYCRSINTALLNNKLFHWCLSRILTIAIELLVSGKDSKAMDHVLHYIHPLKKHENLGITAWYID